MQQHEDARFLPQFAPGRGGKIPAPAQANSLPPPLQPNRNLCSAPAAPKEHRQRREGRNLASVDVIVPCYRYAHFLRECVESVLAQSEVSVRVLIIDDASPDNTAEVAGALAREDPRVTLHRHADNKGHIATYNEGLLDWASANYSLLLSADDALVPGALVRAVRVLDRHGENVGMVYGMARIISDASSSGPAEPERNHYQIISGLRFLQFCCQTCVNPVPTPTAVVRTETQHRLGGYRKEFTHTGDLEMWMRFALCGSVGVLRSVQGYYRWHDSNMSYKYYNQMLSDQREFAHTCESVLAPLAEHGPEFRGLLNLAFERLEQQAYRFAASAFDRGETAEYRAWLEFANNISNNPTHLPLPIRLKARQLLGQALWQKIRPTLSRLRGQPLAPWQGPRFRPSPGQQIGWWPEPT
jgi:hypothetical protein